MDSKARMAMKAFTWQFMGFLVMLGIGYAFTGSFSAGGGIALAATLSGLVSYFGHELLWSKISWGRHPLPLTESRR